VTRSARSAVSVAWQRGHTGPESSTVVHRWISTWSVIHELKAVLVRMMCVSAG